MSYASRYIESAERIISGYDGSMPLHHYLKQYFAREKKFGSRDRKAVAHACYSYFRLGNALRQLPKADRIRIGIFLCNSEGGNWSAVMPSVVAEWPAALDDRIHLVAQRFPAFLEELFPLTEHLSAGIDHDRFIVSHFIQPDVFLRIRPGRQQMVMDQLKQRGIVPMTVSDTCISLPAATKADDVLAFDRDVVVQDRSSQETRHFLEQIRDKHSTWQVWDCCAASGGKSLLVYDVLQPAHLVVSDVRSSIIQNLRRRFGVAGITEFTSMVHDTALAPLLGGRSFQLVICDVPCSGSGTWGRTPEQMQSFTADKLAHYASLQQKISRHAASAVAPGGYLLYITCSVYQQENEQQVAYIRSTTGLQLVESALIQGYGHRADTMFAALFTASPR